MSIGVRSEWVEHARAVLDQAGHRKARARNALIDLLAIQPCALSALEIEDRLREGDQRVARASIYRILELLSEHGLVACLELGDGTTRYELIDPGGSTIITWCATRAGGWCRLTIVIWSVRSSVSRAALSSAPMSTR